MNYQNYFKNYNKSIYDLLNKIDSSDIEQSINLIRSCIEQKGKIYITGNGGSASIASHVSVDFAKVARISSATFNNSNLITCFANDYGYENWVQKAMFFYADKGDLLICISSSGQSKNIINGAKFAKKIGCKVVTLTGFDKMNKVRRIGHINLWLNSKNYNLIEMTHHTWLLSIVDFLANSKIKN